jgi:hypothetical protein
MTDDRGKGHIARRYAPLAFIWAVLVYHSLQFNFVTDDAYISFVFSRNFAEHGQLVFNLGDAVEGYTNFLWTFVLGVLMLLGLPPEIMSLVLGTGFGLGTMWLVFRLSEQVWQGRSAWDYLPPALLAMASGFACWSSGGLETQMFTFFVTLAIVSYVRGDSEPRKLRTTGVAMALAAMTRPEGLLVAGIIGLHRLALNLGFRHLLLFVMPILRDRLGDLSGRDRRLVPHREELLCIAYFLALWAPWFAWRWWYYGYPFPNTYYVKAAGEAPAGYAEQMLANGQYYVWQWLTQTKLLYVAWLAAIGMLVARPRSPRFVFGTLAVPLVAAYLVYTIKVGGDFMGLHRFVMPLFVIAAVAVPFGLRVLVSLIKVDKPRLVVGLVAGVVVAGAFGISQIKLTRESMRFGNWASDKGIDTPAYLWIYAHDRAAIGKAMAPCFRDGDFSIWGGAGAKPYYANTPGIDVFGLVSERIAHEVKPTRARAGHNKWAPDSLLAEHDPTFVFSCYSIHGDPKRPRLNCSPGFWLRKGYEQTTMHVPGLLQQGEYYTFFVKKERQFECDGVIR